MALIAKITATRKSAIEIVRYWKKQSGKTDGWKTDLAIY